MVNRPQSLQRPNGRSERVRHQVHQAVIDLLEELTADDVTIPLIAERSGVHQATIYRRWGTVPVVLQDVVEPGPARTAPLPDTGSLRGDLEQYAVGVAASLSGPLGVLMLRAAVSDIQPGSERGPSVVLTERRAQLEQMLDRARERGESPPTVDELLELVVAPLYFRALFGPPPNCPATSSRPSCCRRCSARAQAQMPTVTRWQPSRRASVPSTRPASG
jgi:AcrR family transcriptional regulator